MLTFKSTPLLAVCLTTCFTACLTAVLWATVAAPALRAQDAPAASASTFGEVIDVRVVNLEVVVTEDGNRVIGLRPDDFRLTVDGREVALEYFTEVLGGTAVIPTGETAGASVPALAPGKDVGTSYLVFIDDFFAIAADRNRVLKRMIEQLPNLTPEDRMAVVAYDGKEIDMLSSWSQSAESLTRTFEQALERDAYGLQRIAEHRLFETTRTDARSLGDVPTFGNTGLTIDEEQHADVLTRQVERMVLATSSVLRGFANPPGRKVMLLLSGGWPYNPAFWVIDDPARQVYASSFLRHGDQLYRPLADTANRLSYTLYTVDVPGLDSTSGADPSIGNVDEADFRTRLSRNREHETELALIRLAEDTGGRALLDSASVDAFQRVVEDTRSYYWLGFTPAWKGDDQVHKVEVEVRRPGLKVRTRQDFSDLSRQTEVTMMVESSLRFGDPPTNTPLAIQMGVPQKAGRRTVNVPLRIAIPLDGLTFLPQGDGWVAETELRVAVLDDRGDTADIPVIPLAFRLEQAPAAGKYTLYETAVALRNRKHDAVLSIYDLASGRILSTKITVDPEELAKMGAKKEKDQKKEGQKK